MESLNIIIETTRRCNMACQHCLRGEAQNCDISIEYIDALLDQFDGYISSITFTGGEPSLNVRAMQHTLQTCKSYNIGVGSFYIATNGLDVKEDFVVSCLRWFAYCDDKEECRVDCSNDGFHADEGQYNTELLGGLSFFGRKYEKEAQWYSGREGMINQGNYAENYGDGRLEEAPNIETFEDLRDTTIYLNCNGDIINGCDWSYESQQQHILCKVQDLKAFVSALPED